MPGGGVKRVWPHRGRAQPKLLVEWDGRRHQENRQEMITGANEHWAVGAATGCDGTVVPPQTGMTAPQCFNQGSLVWKLCILEQYERNREGHRTPNG